MDAKKVSIMMIREATRHDLSTVLEVERRAFGNNKEAELVRNLLNDNSASPMLSLLAWKDEQAIGHILFTTVTIVGVKRSLSTSILAPLAVVQEAQAQGVGSALIQEGLRRLTEVNVDLVFVLGHPDYYPRFGFKPAERLGLEAPFPIPMENAGAWMVQELRPGVLGKITGRVQCADTMNRPEFWRE